MIDESEWSVSASGHDEGVIWKTTRRHKRYKLGGTRSKGCGNYQDLSRWWHDVSYHGWGIIGVNLGKTRKLVYV